MTSAEKSDVIRQLVNYEYNHACVKHPQFADGSIEQAYVILGEEVGEVAKAIYEKDFNGMVSEIAQVAAVCERFIGMALEMKEAPKLKPKLQ